MEKLKSWGVVALLFVGSISTSLSAQMATDSILMSLDECLKYAKENSITLQQARLQIDNSEADQLSARGAFLPSISASVGQTLNSNPLLTESDVSNSSYSGSYGVDLSLSLYNGGKNRALLQQSNVNSEVSNLELSEFENTIEMSVTEVYVEILYAIEQIKVAEQSLTVGIKNEERGKSLLEVGSINSSDLAQLESAKASYQYNLVVAQTQLSSLYVRLKHLLEISQEIVFTVKEPDLSDELLLSVIPSIDDVYSWAVIERPEIKSTTLRIESAELDAKIARAGYLPTLSLTAGTGLSHNSASSFTFSNQLRNNFDTSVGLHLSIPIFNKNQTKSAVIKSDNYIKSANIELTQAQKELYQTIETLHNNAQTAQAKYSVSEYKLQALDKSLKLATEQYELGMKNTIELLTEQDNYNQSSQEYLINKYQLILNKALLNYYKTDVIKL